MAARSGDHKNWLDLKSAARPGADKRRDLRFRKIPHLQAADCAHYLSYLGERGQGLLCGRRAHRRGDRGTRQGPATSATRPPLTRLLAMMLVMVGYTFTGLYLLLGG